MALEVIANGEKRPMPKHRMRGMKLSAPKSVDEYIAAEARRRGWRSRPSASSTEAGRLFVDQAIKENEFRAALTYLRDSVIGTSQPTQSPAHKADESPRRHLHHRAKRMPAMPARRREVRASTMNDLREGLTSVYSDPDRSSAFASESALNKGCQPGATSPWIRGAPHSGFSRLIKRISSVFKGDWRSSRLAAAHLPGPDHPEPLRCQAITVSGFTMTRADRQPVQNGDNRAQRNRSAAVSFGRFTERCKTLSCWRRASTSI